MKLFNGSILNLFKNPPSSPLGFSCFDIRIHKKATEISQHYPLGNHNNVKFRLQNNSNLYMLHLGITTRLDWMIYSESEAEENIVGKPKK